MSILISIIFLILNIFETSLIIYIFYKFLKKDLFFLISRIISYVLVVNLVKTTIFWNNLI